MPPSLDVTVPLPKPTVTLLTVRVNRCMLKVAVTDLDAFMVTVQVVPETVSQPLQPPKVDPPLALAVSVPLPVPPLLTVRVNRCTLKVAVTDLDAFMVTVQVMPETVSQPLQPPKVDPPLALAVSVTIVPLS